MDQNIFVMIKRRAKFPNFEMLQQLFGWTSKIVRTLPVTVWTIIHLN